MKGSKILSWVLRIVAAVILLQTLYFKFSGAEESVYIFSQLGIEPWGRIATGIIELLAATLILLPKTKMQGALLTAAIMTGAVLAHFLKLGIEVQNDNGLLFVLAITVLLCSLGIIILHKKNQKKLNS